MTEHVRLYRFIISFVHQDGEWIGRLRRFRHNRFMFGERWLAPDPGIIKIVARWSASCWFRIRRDRQQSAPIVTACCRQLLYQASQRRQRWQDALLEPSILIIAGLLGQDRVDAGHEHEFVGRRKLHDLAGGAAAGAPSPGARP